MTNWHVFEPRSMQVGGVSSKVSKAGVGRQDYRDNQYSQQNITARGSRYLTPKSLDQQVAMGAVTVVSEERDKDGSLKKVKVESERYVESDTALISRC